MADSNNTPEKEEKLYQIKLADNTAVYPVTKAEAVTTTLAAGDQKKDPGDRLLTSYLECLQTTVENNTSCIGGVQNEVTVLGEKFDSHCHCTSITDSTGQPLANTKLTANTTYTLCTSGINSDGKFAPGTSFTFTTPEVQTSVSGNAGTADEFSSEAAVKLTGDVTGSASSTKGWELATSISPSAVTNSMLAGSISNDKLVNNTVTLGTTSVSLGGSTKSIKGLDEITATTFTGDLTGNATTSTTATCGIIGGKSTPFGTAAAKDVSAFLSADGKACNAAHADTVGAATGGVCQPIYLGAGGAICTGKTIQASAYHDEGYYATADAFSKHGHQIAITTPAEGSTSRQTLASGTSYSLTIDEKNPYVFTTPNSIAEATHAQIADKASCAENFLLTGVSTTFGSAAHCDSGCFLPTGTTFDTKIIGKDNSEVSTLSANTPYTLCAGGTSFAFTTPPGAVYTAGDHLKLENGKFSVCGLGTAAACSVDTWLLKDGVAVQASKLGDSDVGNTQTPIYLCAGVPTAGLTLSSAAYCDATCFMPRTKTFAVCLAKNTDAAQTSKLTLEADTKYQLCAGGQSFYFTTAPLQTSVTGDAGTVGGHTVCSDVPAGAKFTDTVYTNATPKASGLMSSQDKGKLDELDSSLYIRAVPVTWDEDAGNWK